MPVKKLVQRDKKMPVIEVRRKKLMRRGRTGGGGDSKEEKEKEEREQEAESGVGPIKTTVAQVDFQSWLWVCASMSYVDVPTVVRQEK